MNRLLYLSFALIVFSCQKESNLQQPAKFDYRLLKGSWVNKTGNLAGAIQTDSLFFGDHSFSYLSKIEMKEGVYIGSETYFRLGTNSLSNYLYNKNNGDQIRNITLKTCEGTISTESDKVTLNYVLNTGVDPVTGLMIAEPGINIELPILKLTKDSLLIQATRSSFLESFDNKVLVRASK